MYNNYSDQWCSDEFSISDGYSGQYYGSDYINNAIISTIDDG